MSRCIGALDLVLAVFRLAVCDYLGTSYGHDDVDRPRRIRGRWRDDAETFLSGAWAAELADAAGFSARTVWLQASSGNRVAA